MTCRDIKRKHKQKKASKQTNKKPENKQNAFYLWKNKCINPHFIFIKYT